MAALSRTRWMDMTNISTKPRPVFRVAEPTPRTVTPKPNVEQGGDDGQPKSRVFIYTCSVRPRNERAEGG